jgi:predicted phage terminase large subunit-like protein
VADGELLRLMVFVPPRHGKSELVSRLFTAYWLYKYPEKWVGLCSYGQELATTLARSARDNFRSCGGEIRFDSKAVQHWETTAGGGMWSAGVGGGITGKGGDLLVVDDPVKDAVEAASAATQKQHQEWWQTTFRSRRASPRTAMIVVQTRWNEMDLSGWLLRQELQRTRPERWHVVAWEALKEAERAEADQHDLGLQLGEGVRPEDVQRVAGYVWPTTVTLEPDWRQPGEALCPERFSAEDLLDTKDGTSAYFWAALYQQRPRPREGMLFKAEHFTVVQASEVPRMRAIVRCWDYASTEKAASADPDYTAGVKLGIGTDGNVYVWHVVRGQWASAMRDRIIYETATMDGYAVPQGREQEPGASGKDTAIQFLARFAAWNPFVRPASGSKFERADPLVAKAQSTGIRLVAGPWNQAFVDELISFGSGTAHDDATDAAAGAYSRVLQIIRVQENNTDGVATGSVSTKSYN